ncbi:hypothetical protein EIN_339380 [Entamoeba invadens IP1]|uniref:Leucine rich repeat containing protein BspA family protein n=1 Tax=Entamoeba invadens IP1 TaxID=370355 RepID=A0A0A1U770_ENTIV|nr:hypothetical protein EIN_339380 [Entamoeba invadens IP1]ELP90257.1 hypothetical protein EIN_339380 [Entamoeba invadens IP1]|eukprot:XP_004257028.1 hypothetical protein EIN_339380 [Entamoeba invadens IP1]
MVVENCNITEVGKYAFSGTKIKELIIHDNVKYGDGAFSNCGFLQKVDLGNTTVIPNYFFKNCTALAKIVNFDKITEFGGNCFDSVSIEGELKLNGTAKYGSSVFAGCDKITKVVLNEFTEVLYGMFTGCYNLAEIVGLESVTKVGSLAFKNTSLTEFEYLNTTTYGFNVVMACRNLVKVILNDYLELEGYEFSDCVKLTEIVGLEKVTLFNSYALSNTGLTEITFNPSAKFSLGNTLDGTVTLKKANLNGLTKLIKGIFRNCTKLDEIIGLENVVDFGEEALWNTAIKSVKIGASTKYANRVFGGCQLLTEADFEGVTSIPANIFNNSQYLKTLKNTENITSVSEFAFSGCKSLTKVDFFEKLENFGQYAFSGTGIIEVNLVPKITYGEGAFAFCTSLKRVDLKGKKYIQPTLFSGCSSLETVLNSEFAEIIGVETFKGCTSLKKFEFNQDAVFIYDGTFSVTGFEQIELHNQLIYEKNAYSGCQKLTTVDLQDVERVSFAMFDQCPKLSYIKYSDSLKSIQADAFANTESLKGIHLGKGIEVINKNAFGTTLKAIFYHGQNDVEVETNAVNKETVVYTQNNYTKDTFAGLKVKK